MKEKDRRIVIKLGTNVVVDKTQSFDLNRLRTIVEDVSKQINCGDEIVLISSGAVGLGKSELSESQGIGSGLAFKQACASIGQNLLMAHYRKLFSEHGLKVAQVLVTSDDLSDRKRYLNLRSMISELLRLGVVPIINENDSVSTMELREYGKDKSFGDNDKLSALVACKIDADFLVILTDVDGLYVSDPKEEGNSERISLIENVEDFKKIGISAVGLKTSQHGRGGIATKLEAAKLSSMSGVHCVIASGHCREIIHSIFSSRNLKEISNHGSLIVARGKVSARKHWIGFSSGVSGGILVNQGAEGALVQSAASLLAVGVVGVSGTFEKGDVVEILSESEAEIGRGVVNFSSDDVMSLAGKPDNEIIHRDRLVIFVESETESVNGPNG